MGKNHRLKKKLKSERGKTQITTKTKFLPKGQNVTNTAFKIKPIVLQEQLRSTELITSPHLLSGRKFNVKEIVSKLKHHSDKTKEKGCEELLELFKRSPNHPLSQHLWELVPQVAALVQSREKKLRKMALGIVDPLSKHARIEPYFKSLSVHLRCAMTHIDRYIQEDSLLFVDKLLQNVPDLIASHSGEIFPDFLALISRLRRDSGVERTLTLHLGGKYTSVQWRIAVLGRLYGLMKAMVAHQNKSEKTKESPSCKVSDSRFVPIYSRNIYTNYSMYSYSNTSSSNGANFEGIFQQHMKSLVALLHENLREIVPEKAPGKEATVLFEESAVMFSCCIHIFNLLYTYSLKNNFTTIFSSKECDQLMDFLQANFPYSKTNRHDQKPLLKDVLKVFSVKDDPRCVEENLIIAHLICTLKSKSSTKTKVGSLGTYINQCLATPEFAKSSSSKKRPIISFLSEILSGDRNRWHRIGLNTNEILESVLKFVEMLPAEDQCKVETIAILADNWAQLRYYKSVGYKEWIEKLPDVLLCRNGVVAEEVVRILLDLSKTDCHLFHDGLKRCLGDILSNLQALDIKGSDVSLAKLHLAYLFYYVPELEQSHFDQILEFYRKNEGSEYATNFRAMCKRKFPQKWKLVAQEA